MFINSLLSYIPVWFKEESSKQLKESSTYKSELEQFIISKNPQTCYDVEHWIREYDRKVVNKVWW